MECTDFLAVLVHFEAEEEGILYVFRLTTTKQGAKTAKNTGR